MNKVLKSTALVAAAGAAIFGGVATGANQAAAWGPVREVYTYQDINSDWIRGTWPQDKIVFNSITNTPNFGDERNFVGAREYNGNDDGFDNVWNANDITVKNGQTYKLRLYVHNNSPWGYDGVATNVRASFSIPSISATQVQVNGFVYSKEAETVWDYVNFNSADGMPFHLEYVFGSAILGNSGIGDYRKYDNGLGYPLSDEVVTKSGGTLIGYDAIDGRIPGCYDFASYVTIEVKAVYDTDYYVSKMVRRLGDNPSEWGQTVDAEIGDEVEFEIEYRNLSTDGTRHNNVMIKDILPKNMEYVPGTTILYNNTHPDGYRVNEDDITTVGINIGDYNAQSNAFVYFTAKIVDKTMQCGGNILANWAQAGVGQKTIQDYATVYVTKVCTEEEIPQTGPEALAGGAIAAGSIVTAAGYFIASRRSLR